MEPQQLLYGKRDVFVPMSEILNIYQKVKNKEILKSKLSPNKKRDAITFVNRKFSELKAKIGTVKSNMRLSKLKKYDETQKFSEDFDPFVMKYYDAMCREDRCTTMKKIFPEEKNPEKLEEEFSKLLYLNNNSPENISKMSEGTYFKENLVERFFNEYINSRHISDTMFDEEKEKFINSVQKTISNAVPEMKNGEMYGKRSLDIMYSKMKSVLNPKDIYASALRALGREDVLRTDKFFAGRQRLFEQSLAETALAAKQQEVLVTMK